MYIKYIYITYIYGIIWYIIIHIYMYMYMYINNYIYVHKHLIEDGKLPKGAFILCISGTTGGTTLASCNNWWITVDHGGRFFFGALPRLSALKPPSKP